MKNIEKKERLQKIMDREKELQKISAIEQSIHLTYSDLVHIHRPVLKDKLDISVYRALRFVIFREMFGCAVDEILKHVGSRLAREWACADTDELVKKFRSMGLGILEVLHFSKERCAFRLYESVSAAGLPPLNEAVCIFEGGILAGASHYLLAQPFIVQEKSCVAKKDEFCEFILEPVRDSQTLTPETEFIHFLADQHLWKENSEIMAALTSNYLKFKHNEEMAIRDGLTGLFNHRFFQEKIREEMKRSKRTSKSLSLIILDIDHFKTFNDNYGHQQGDTVLKTVARLISSQIRSTDFTGRYGGEEFVVILPETESQPAKETADKIRNAVASHKFVLLNKETNVTLSAGIATYPDHAREIPVLIEKADTALYHSKDAGRNRSTLWSEELGL